MTYVALITGASSGIGEALARRLAREPGTRLVLVARRQARLQALAAELGGATVIVADLTEPEAGARIRATIEHAHIASTAARVSRPNSGAYSASKFALAGWSDALHNEERSHGVHVGLVLPGFVKTEGFPSAELLAKPYTRWLATEPERVAEAIIEAGPGGKPERYVPRYYWIAAALRTLAPGLVRRATSGGAFTTATREQSR